MWWVQKRRMECCWWWVIIVASWSVQYRCAWRIMNYTSSIISVWFDDRISHQHTIHQWCIFWCICKIWMRQNLRRLLYKSENLIKTKEGFPEFTRVLTRQQVDDKISCKLISKYEDSLPSGLRRGLYLRGLMLC